eukprot:GFUD01013487.1.p1 GENE.GFUD01013487.1~~GFUD01013487.1.p1  ORF type:complete len:408 (-),score=77.54 GFUD01013487.1:428-1651(-)
MAEKESPFDIDDVSQLNDVPQEEEAEGSVGSREVALLTVRTFTVFLLVLGGVWLCLKVFRRRRGSWKEAGLAVSIQIIWQVLAWYSRHIDANWVLHLTSGTVDSETTRKVFNFVENLFHALAIYTGMAVVGRLAGVVGTLLWIFCGMSILAPLVFAIIILLLDLSLNAEDRHAFATTIGVASGKMVILNLLPLGMLICWLIGHCRTRTTRKSTRELASTIISGVLIVFHLVNIAQWIVYVITKNTDSFELKVALVDVDVGLIEAGYLLACLAIPWAWFIGLIIPIPGSSQETLNVNLKLAKQNKTRNIVKYKKDSDKSKPIVATPPTSPQKFSPEVTSSPSVHSQFSSPLVNPTPMSDILPGEKKSKRRSYMEAVSNSSINVLENAPPRQSKSADPLWLPSSKPVEL